MVFTVYFPAITWYILINTRQVQRRKESFPGLYQKRRSLVMDLGYLARLTVTLQVFSQVPCIHVWSTFRLHSSAECFRFVNGQICVLLFSRWRIQNISKKNSCLLDMYSNREHPRVQVKLSLCFALWVAINTSIFKANINKKCLDSF